MRILQVPNRIRQVKSSLAEQIIEHFNKLLQNCTTQKWSKFDTNTMWHVTICRYALTNYMNNYIML